MLLKNLNVIFTKLNNSEFNKICHKYEIILMRFDNVIKYKQIQKSDLFYVLRLQLNILMSNFLKIKK